MIGCVRGDRALCLKFNLERWRRRLVLLGCLVSSSGRAGMRLVFDFIPEKERDL